MLIVKSVRIRGLLCAALLFATGWDAVGAVHYVAVNNPTPVSPFTNWATAAAVLQDAADAADPGDTIVVTNGLYQLGGFSVDGVDTNRLAITKPLLVQSVNGPEFTLIAGDPSVSTRCVYLTNGAILIGFTLTNGAASEGGGAWAKAGVAVIINCNICGNSASSGGGVAGGNLYNCTLGNNLAFNGGGAADSVLANCLLTNNLGGAGGGASDCTLNDCILGGNGNAYGSGGGAYLSVLSNCLLTNNFAEGALYSQGIRNGGYGGGVYGGVLTNCTLVGNSSSDGGGAYSATLVGCILNSNTAGPIQNILGGNGGGAESSTLINCWLIGNSANPAYGLGGGGASDCALTNCTLVGNKSSIGGGGAVKGYLSGCVLGQNTASIGGAAVFATNINSVFTNNSAGYGGAVAYGTCYNSAFKHNSAFNQGGGAFLSTLINCSVSANSASEGGGVFSTTLINSIVFFNTATFELNYDDGSSANYCCLNPLPDAGIGNFDSDPQLLDFEHISSNSPCIGRGNYAVVAGVDIDNEPWGNPPSVGCDEPVAANLSGPLSLGILASATVVTPGFEVGLEALVSGKVTGSEWNFGDGTGASNQLYTAHTWQTPGAYLITLTAWNESNPSGVMATAVVQVVTRPLLYVALDSTNPVAPYSSWATAATNIQDAVDAASVAGSLVLVSNGVYQNGARLVYGVCSNRLAITKPIIIQSVNGPGLTSIQGYANSNQAVSLRCVYLTNQAALCGFAITNGATLTTGDSVTDQSGGGVWCESTAAVVSNCVVSGNYAQANGGGSYSGTIIDSTVASNSASSGGGAYGSALENCLVTGNSSSAYGGGVYLSVLSSSTVSSNRTTGYPGDGGGAYLSRLETCTVQGNSAPGPGSGGGGAISSTLINCFIKANSAYGAGGGVHTAQVRNCALTQNIATGTGPGGGACSSTLNNCTLTGNRAGGAGGGVSGSTLTNCIVYNNQAPAGSNYDASTLVFCCALPLPTNGMGNFSADPELASASHLSAFSPCIGKGTATGVSGTDIDGEPWASPPSIGCDEFYAGSVTGALSVAIEAGATGAAVGTSVSLASSISGKTTGSFWDFEDGQATTNQPQISHSWSTAGAYDVVLTAFNESNPGGISATVTVQVITHPLHFVALGNRSPLAPYTSWATAATNISDAIDVAEPGSTVLVLTGIYQFGGRVVHGLLTNRVAVTKPIQLRSVYGPINTIIQGATAGGGNGDAAVRCAYLTNGATLSGFTLTGGATRSGGNPDLEQSGGGVWCEGTNATVTNCIITSNTAYSFAAGAYSGTLFNCSIFYNSSGGSGGGAGLSVLNHCTLSANSGYGGGAAAATLSFCDLNKNSGSGAVSCTLYRCTLFGNSAAYGGGAQSCTLADCILTNNSAVNGGGAYSCSLESCLLIGNIASNPGIAGGGAFSSVLNNCTVVSNIASSVYGLAGGVGNSTLTNCIVVNNSASSSVNYFTGCD